MIVRCALWVVVGLCHAIPSDAHATQPPKLVSTSPPTVEQVTPHWRFDEGVFCEAFGDRQLDFICGDFLRWHEADEFNPADVTATVTPLPGESWLVHYVWSPEGDNARVTMTIKKQS